MVGSKWRLYNRVPDIPFESMNIIMSAQDLLYVATPGEFCGVLSALTGEPSFITVMAAAHSHLIAITKTNLYQ